MARLKNSRLNRRQREKGMERERRRKENNDSSWALDRKVLFKDWYIKRINNHLSSTTEKDCPLKGFQDAQRSSYHTLTIITALDKKFYTSNKTVTLFKT